VNEACERVGVVYHDDLCGGFSWCCSAASSWSATRTHRSNRCSRNETGSSQTSSPASRANASESATQSPSELNPNHAKIYICEPTLEQMRMADACCERLNNPGPSQGRNWPIRFRGCPNTSPAVQKLQGRQRRKLALNKQAHRVGQVHKLQSRTRPAPCGQRLWNPEDGAK